MTNKSVKPPQNNNLSQEKVVYDQAMRAIKLGIAMTINSDDFESKDLFNLIEEAVNNHTDLTLEMQAETFEGITTLPLEENPIFEFFKTIEGSGITVHIYNEYPVHPVKFGKALEILGYHKLTANLHLDLRVALLE